MPKRFIALLGLAIAAAIALPAGAAHRSSHVSKPMAAMSGLEEPGGGDANGYGAARFEIKGRRVCFVILAREIDPVVAGHIHRGAVGQNGPIVVDLLGAGNTGLPGRRRDCVNASSRALAREIGHNPTRFYVNLHNAAFPDGAIRGQLSR
jgi:CHRD domain